MKDTNEAVCVRILSADCSINDNRKSNSFKIRQGANPDPVVHWQTGKVTPLTFNTDRDDDDGSLAVAHRLFTMPTQMATLHAEVNIDDQRRRCAARKATMIAFTRRSNGPLTSCITANVVHTKEMASMSCLSPLTCIRLYATLAASINYCERTVHSLITVN